MTINNPAKFILGLVGMTCTTVLTVLLLTHSISSDAGIALISAITGYGIGNGIAAKAGLPVEPVFAVKPKEVDE